MELDWMKLGSTAVDIFKTVSTSQATNTAASAATTAANANLQAQQLAQQNLQNQLLLAQKTTQPATSQNKTLLWVSIGVGAAILVTVIIVVLAKRR